MPVLPSVRADDKKDEKEVTAAEDLLREHGVLNRVPGLVCKLRAEIDICYRMRGLKYDALGEKIVEPVKVLAGGTD